MKIEMPEGFSEAFKEIDKYGLAPLRFFYSGKDKITPLSSKSFKRISGKFKNIQCYRSAILEICNIPEK